MYSEARRLSCISRAEAFNLLCSDIDLEDPSVRIRVRAQRFSPDMFYVNEFAERIYQIDPGTFNRLFG